MRIRTRQFFIMVLLCASAAAFAAGEDAAGEFEPRHQGFYYALPAYLYRTSSASGLQLGYQMGKMHFRLDASIVSDTINGETAIFTNPSIGVFSSHDWESKIRTYGGVSIGMQKGIWQSFDGMSYFFTFMTGVEWFVFERKAIFLEIGSGTGVLTKEGSFEGGTIIGGGIKCFF